ncbi:MAG: cytochrome c biogenesis protein CcdA [Bacteroidota bacterium]|nr:cytochrome c biogenesis protein CcdA [Bacteroidota bacterium]
MSIFRKLILLVSSVFLFVNANAQQLHAHWDIKSKKVSDCEYDIVFSVKIDPTWHLYSIIPLDDGPNPTAIKFTKSPDYELVGKLKESKPKEEQDKVFEVLVKYFEGEATFTQRVKALKPGKISIAGKYEYQVCTDAMCEFPPAEKFTVNLESTCATNQSALVSTNSDSVAIVDSTAQAMAVVDTSSKTSALPIAAETLTDSESSIQGKAWWLIFLSGFVWGFLALFTPCVFPLIPMNMSFFLKRSQTKTKGKVNAIVYALSIIVIFVSLGLGIALIWGGGALHTFSTSAGFNLVIFAMLLVFAASFLGAFEIVLPSSFVNKIDKQSDRGGYIGIFFMALALVVISFSCTGPMIGNALVAASTSGNKTGAFWAMFGFSSGLALPFGFFAFFPSLLNSMPKSGGWLNTVKVVLGFLELALALKFASNVDLVYQLGILTREVFITLWVVIFALMTIYLMGGFKTAHDSDVKNLSVTRIFFIIISFSITIYLIPGLFGAPLKLFSGVLPPLEYSESPHGFGGNQDNKNSITSSVKVDEEFAKYIEVNKNGVVHFKNEYDKALAYAKKVGKPLMVDFTGHACANCRKTEDYVWPDAEVTKRLNNDVVLVSLYVDDKRELDPKDYMKVNWYGKEREITDIGDKFKYMEETLYKQSTQPLYVLLDHNEKLLSTPRGYDPNIPDYIKWMDEAVNKFKALKK